VIQLSGSPVPFKGAKQTLSRKIAEFKLHLHFRYMVWSGYYTWNAEPVRCTKCDSWHHSDHMEVIKDRIDWTPCEVELHCKRCNNVMGYWAYGYWMPPFI
jgi:hypothetical protein